MKYNQRAEKLRRSIGLGRAAPDHSAALMSVARRFARVDRQHRPVHCEFARKLIYDTDEIARSTGQQLARLAARPHYLYPCGVRDPRLGGRHHWHLTTQPNGPRGEANEQA